MYVYNNVKYPILLFALESVNVGVLINYYCECCYRFDYILFKACMVLRSISSRLKHIYRMIVRELSGQLYLMTAQYLYLEGNWVRVTELSSKDDNIVVNKL